MKEQKNELMKEWTNKRIKKRMKERMNKQMNEQKRKEKFGTSGYKRTTKNNDTPNFSSSRTVLRRHVRAHPSLKF